MKKKINLRWRIVLCMLLSLGYYANSFAIDYYWIGKGTTNNWSLPGNWATTSGASVSDVLYPPTKNDNVIFDENSFPTGGSVASRTITINTGATCDSFTFRDIPTEIVPVMNITVTLAVGGSATLWPGMTVSGSNGTIKSESERTAETFTSAGVVLTNTNIVFAGNSNYVANGNLTARDITLSGDGNRTFGGYVDCKSFVKTGTGNVNITSYLQSNLPVNDRNIEFSGGGDMTVGGDVKIESVLHNYSGVSPYLTGGNFTFAGNGNLTISGDLYVPNAYISNSGNVDLSGSGTKIISGDVTAGKRFVSNGGTVNVGGDLIILDTGHSLYSPSETGTNPKIFGGCKMTIAGHIKGDSSLSISGTGTDVKVNGTGDFSEFYDLYIVTGAKFTHQDVIVLKRDWNSSGGVSFTTATAPSLIRINTGNFTANATDVYDNVEFFGLPFAGRNYHTINQGTYNKITFSAGSGSISTTAGITTKELIINSEAEYVFSNTTTVNNRLEIKPQRCGGMIQVTNGTIAMGAGSTVVAENLLLTNNTITGGTFTATNSVDKGGNSGWNFSNTPKTLYWVGGTGDWNDISHWANSSGGAAGSGCIPALLDNVVFNGTSGLSGSQTVSVPAGYHAYCNNMTWTGTGTPVLKITDEPNTRLYIGGSLELALGMTIDNSEFNRTVYTNITSIDRRGIYFVSTRNSPYETIRTNGVEIMGTVSFISGAPGTTGSGGWVFQDDWAGTACIYFERGSLNTNGKALTATWFRSTVGTRTLNIAGSTITLNDAWSYYGTGSNFLTNAETANSLIKIILPDYGDGLYYANNSPICGFQGKAGEKYNNLDFSVAYPLYAWDLSPSRTVREGIFNKITLSSNSLEVDPILGSGIQTDSLILTGIQGAIFTLSDNITVNKYLESPQGCGLPSILRSSSTTSRTITMGGLGDPDPRMNVKMKNTVINNVKITGGPIPLGGYYAEDCDLEIGTETGWNPVSSAGNKRYYWVGGNGDWNEIEHWSDRSDGPGSVFCTPPSAINTVVFDHNSFKANNCVVTISDSRAKCDSMLWVGTVSETPKLLLSRDRNSKLTVWGSMLLQQNMTVSGTDEPSYGYHSEINFKSQRPKESLVTNEVKFEKVEIIFNVSGEWSIPHKVRFSGGQSYHLTFDGTSTAKWIFGDDLDISTPFGEIHFNRGTLDLSGITVNVSSRFTSSGTPDPNRKLIIKNTTLNVGSMTACMWNYNGILTAVDSYNSVINFKIISINMTTAANQVYNDVNFSTDPYYQASSSSTINAPAGANTTQFRKVTFGVNQGIVNNGKFEYLHFKNYGTMNTIEADTLRFNNNNEYIYTFISGTTSTINEKWYGSGLPCYRLRYQSSVEGDPAFVRVKKEAATYIDPVNGDVLFLDFIRVNDIIVSQGPGLALIEKGPGSPDDEVCWDGRTYNLTSWMTLANGWIRTPYDPVLRPMPDATIRCANFPYVIDPYQFVTTPESTYEWRKGGSAGTILNPGDPNRSTWTINSAADAGLYYLKVDYHPEGAGKTCLIDGVVMISTIASDSLVWTGQIDTDWNKPGNWYDPAMFATSTFAPTACTDVLIPKNISRYPNLTPGNTDYSQLFYERASCHHIWFEHGGEVVRTDSLNYLKAHVELTLAANRWNMITAPLRYMYPGDYYKNVPCPHEDQLRIYQQLFAMSNPQTGVNLEGNWTEPFNNPEIAMPAGFGYAVKLLDNGTLLDGTPVSNETDWVPAMGRHSMWFPKNDTEYNIYVIRSSDGQGNPPFTASCTDIDDTRQLSRGSGFDNYRFIYEDGNSWRTTGDVTLTTAGATGTGKQVIVGNPFMAHWDLSNFAVQNPGKFKEEYKVLESGNDAAFVTYSPLTSTNKLVAPMQSVLITSTAIFGATDLKTNVKSMAQSPGNILKSAASDESNLLKITAEKEGKSNSTHILYDAMVDNNYDLNKDSYKLFVTEVTKPVAVYTRSQDGIALDINVFGNTDEMIPLAVRTSTTGTINLQFGGADNFYKLYLIDTLYPNRPIDLKETPEYSFDKTTSDLFMDGRLFLSVGRLPDSDFFPTQGAVSVFTSGKQLQVVSDSSIDEVQVFDMQGRMLHQARNIDASAYTCNLSNSGMYVVKVLTGKSVTIKKVTIDK